MSKVNFALHCATSPLALRKESAEPAELESSQRERMEKGLEGLDLSAEQRETYPFRSVLKNGTFTVDDRIWNPRYRDLIEIAAFMLADFDEEISGFTMKSEVVEGLERIGVKGKQR